MTFLRLAPHAQVEDELPFIPGQKVLYQRLDPGTLAANRNLAGKRQDRDIGSDFFGFDRQQHGIQITMGSPAPPAPSDKTE